MNFSLMAKRLLRWYIVIPALVLPAALAVGAWFLVGPTYERSATLLLVPGVGTVPDAENPYFYLSGLTQAADVVVRAVGSENVRRDVKEKFDGVAVSVSRDPTTAGPVILIVADAHNDTDASAALEMIVQRTRTELSDLQVSDRIARSDQIQVRPVTVDDHSTVRQRTRLVATVGVGGLAAVFIVFAAALAQMLVQRSRSRSIRKSWRRDGAQIQWDDWLPSNTEVVSITAGTSEKVTSGAGRAEAS